MVRRTTREVVELAAKACKHAEDGNYMSILIGRRPWALARTKLAMRASDACRSSGTEYRARKPGHPASQRQRPARRRDAASAEL